MNNNRNIYVGYTVVLCGIVGLAGFLVGYDRGERFGETTNVVTIYETVELPPAYADTCASMLEAAWAMEDTQSQLPPHKP